MRRCFFLMVLFTTLLHSSVSLYAPAGHKAGAFDEDFRGLTYGAAAAATTTGTETAMTLQLLNDTKTSGAVCLDGTPGGFYFSKATNASNANDWQIYFQGGGWCYDDKDCWHRSNSHLGSTKGALSTVTVGGLMDSDCGRNPDFCNFNRVFLIYCDGNSFSGNRDLPYPVVEDGQKANLYFRGRRIVDEVLKALSANYGLADAKNVLLTGCSAGGLATCVVRLLEAFVCMMRVLPSAPLSLPSSRPSLSLLLSSSSSSSSSLLSLSLSATCTRTTSQDSSLQSTPRA